ncbi:serine protease family S33 [Achlya hypogyna]|uniref:Serine protease family S33 n=1 Tax=Achlya hypogyna TaxID=1202772 RepID=A0A1V9Z9H1_ACHHY|nr:serine protease family S33 [Achlya hypogyna]
MRLKALAVLAATASALQFNGWYSCSQTTFWRAPSRGRRLVESLAPFADQASVPTTAQCGQYLLPLCHPHVCNSTLKLPVFVKRLPAMHPDTAKVLWVLQGGPGASAVNMEPLMVELYERFRRRVTVMTMDHRGTGRSGRLQCEAAQAMTSGSPLGPGVSLEELPDCLRDINNVYEGHAAGFSVTSAALDILSVVEGYQAQQEVYLYAVSYGTLWVERVIAVQNSDRTRGGSIRGYILDGIVPHSGSARLYFNNWDRNMAAVGWDFLGLCVSDAFCATKFRSTTLQSAVLQLYTDVDANSTACADFVTTTMGGVDGLKTTFGIFLMQSTLRLLIPMVVYRLQRCLCDDVEVLARVWASLRARGVFQTATQEVDLDSELLYSTIAYSELWEKTPAPPTFASIYNQFKTGVMGLQEFTQFPEYCIYTGDGSDDCREFITSGVTFTYPLDMYANMRLRIPPMTSVLMMNGGLDPQTPLWAARQQLQEFQGKRKKLIEFPVAPHGITYTTWTTTEQKSTCGAELILSYVNVGGNLGALDTSCTSRTRPLSFKLWAALGQLLATVDDLYDGVPANRSFNDSSSALLNATITNASDIAVISPTPQVASVSSGQDTPSSSSIGYALAGVFASLLVLTGAAAVTFYTQARKLRKLHHELQDEV